jgi:hypothetical protein
MLAGLQSLPTELALCQKATRGYLAVAGSLSNHPAIRLKMMVLKPAAA